jgi:hypothetical protein
MTKSRTIFQALLGLFLALGLIFSPLQNTTVVFSAQLKDDTTPPQESVPETVVEEPAAEPPPEAQLPVEVDSSPEPIYSETTSEPEVSPAEPVSTAEPDLPTPIVEPAGDVVLEATIIPGDSIMQPTVEETQITEPALSQVETNLVIQPTVQELAVVTNKSESSNTTEEPQTANSDWMSGQVVVHFNPSIPVNEQIARLTTQGLEITSSIIELGVLIVTVPAGLEQETVSAISLLDGIQYAEPVYKASALDVTPNDPGFENQGDMTAINAPGGWAYFTGSSNVIIAIIDTGVNSSQPDLAGKVLPGYNYVVDNNNSEDDNGHGTHVAGIAAAIGNNSTGIAGMDWSAKILPIKVLNSFGMGSALSVSQGIIYAVDHGAKIINLSLGFTTNPTLVANAVEYAYQHGVTVVASTGNTNGAVTYPAALPHVIAVGAVDNEGNRWSLSNYGPEIDLVAPGVDIYSTNRSGYGTRTGTSMAAAHVSGLAALLEGMYPLSPDQIKASMTNTSRDLGTTGWDAFFGNGMIQVKDALLQLFNTLFPIHRKEPHEETPTIFPMPTITPTPTPSM